MLAVDHTFGFLFRNSNDHDNTSLKIDCQGAVGFEIEGDIEEDGEFDVLEEDNVRDIEKKEDSVVKKEDVDHAYEDISKSNSRKESENRNTSKEKDHIGEDGKRKKQKNTNDAINSDETIDGAVAVADSTHDKLEEETKDIAEKLVEELGVEVKDELPSEKLEADEESEDGDYDFEDVSIGGGEQKIVLVAHHEGGDKFEIDFGNTIDDLEFQDDEDEGLANSKAIVGESDLQNSNESNDALKVGVDRDLSPKVESVTRLMETNTLAANQSVSMNVDVSSLRSDSEDEDAMPSGRERISKLDSKVNQFPEVFLIVHEP